MMKTKINNKIKINNMTSPKLKMIIQKSKI